MTGTPYKPTTNSRWDIWPPQTSATGPCLGEDHLSGCRTGDLEDNRKRKDMASLN